MKPKGNDMCVLRQFFLNALSMTKMSGCLIMTERDSVVIVFNVL